MSLCKDCIKGFRHEGTPAGTMEKIGGVECYVGTPTGVDYPQDKVLLFLADAFGLPLVNNKLLVDDFARNGIKTICPDISNGDPVPVDALFGPEGNFDIYAWCAKHGADVARPPLDNVIRALKGSGVTSVGAVGYCYGGRWVFDLAFDGAISVATVAHPSLLAIPADIEKYIATAKAPLLINCCEFDEQFGQEAKKTADALFAGYAPGYKSVYFEGCTHGFAVRGDLSDLKVKAGKEVAFKETVEWVRKYL
ncbi:alpha/beta-hydrolase [Mycena crocata]|nr:alpha/beta-hydrolase [Mycena crocata]